MTPLRPLTGDGLLDSVVHADPILKKQTSITNQSKDLQVSPHFITTLICVT